MSVFFANDRILTSASRDEANHAPEVSGEKSDAVLSKLNGADYDCQFKVTEGGVYILGSHDNAKNACTALFGQPKFAAHNDNKAVSAVRYEFGCARLGVQCRIGNEFRGAAFVPAAMPAPTSAPALAA